MVIFSEADMVVLSSRFDGFGLCVVEGMLAARPALVSDAAGVSEHVQKAGGGWLFPPNPESVSTAIQQAMNDRQQWAEMGMRNQDYVKNHLTWDDTARKTMEMYRAWFDLEK